MNGQNYLVEMMGKLAKHGFYQTFHLGIDSPEQAKELAVQKIRDNPHLKDIVQNPKEDPPIIILEELHELKSFEGVETMETGLLWYRERKWWQFWKRT